MSKVLLEEILTEVLNQKEDRVSTVDLDPSEVRGNWSLTTTGKASHLHRRTTVIVRWSTDARYPAKSSMVKWLSLTARSFPARARGMRPSHLVWPLAY
jgi:hypothetical protein